MLSFKPLVTLLLAAALVGCADRTDTITGQPLPHDTKNLSIHLPGKPPVRFVAPSGWRIAQQPERTQNFTYVLSHDGKFEEPFLTVSCDKAAVTPDTDQIAWHEARLRALRADPFGDAGLEQRQEEHDADNDSVLIYYYIAVDGERLSAMIPEEGYTTEVRLEAQSPADIVANEPAFLAVLHSLHTR